ncbi:MAG: hypothetical protein QOI48_2994 [Solirubrobacteraceae bacterium]|jgi:hypothetical protein|nr:hypothetical protein [Solirubrobacteraceae bacterium]
MAPPTTKAVIHLSRDVSEATKLKRLALLFDQVHYVLPLAAGISAEALADPSRYTVTGGRLNVHDFNYFRDVDHGYVFMHDNLDPEVRHTLVALTEAGIVVDGTDELSSTQRDGSYAQVRKLLLSRDVRDPKWNRMTGTKVADYHLANRLAKVILARDGDADGVNKMVWWHLQEPDAVFAADQIASAAYLADLINGAPVFEARYGDLLAYRYEQLRAGLAELNELGHAVPDVSSFGGRFGEIAFSVANSVFSSESVARHSVEDIIRYRGEMDIARRRFISEDILELTSLVTENPWDARARDEITRFVNTKLAGDVAKFEAASTSTWEKLHGALAVRAGTVVQTSGVGTVAGGVAGNILPHASVWGMLIGGALVGATKELKGVIKDVVEAMGEDRALRRTGVAYVARFGQRQLAKGRSSRRRSRR